MKQKIKDAFNNEIKKGKELVLSKDYDRAFTHFERAHILGQAFVWEHTLSHLWMLKIGIETKNFKEIWGQVLRIPAGIIGSAIGVIPVGNTGGSNVSAVKPMAIPDDLKRILEGDS